MQEVRSHQINVRMSAEERGWLKTIRKHLGLTEPNIIRFLVKREFDRVRECLSREKTR